MGWEIPKGSKITINLRKIPVIKEKENSALEVKENSALDVRCNAVKNSDGTPVGVLKNSQVSFFPTVPHQSRQG